MDNLQKKSNILNFWLIEKIDGYMVVESDIVKTQFVTDDDFEQFLLGLDKIGTFYNDYTEQDDTYTYKDFMKETDAHEINCLLDKYLKDIIPENGQHFDLLHQDQKHELMYEGLPAPTDEDYNFTSEQRPTFEQIIFEKTINQKHETE